MALFATLRRSGGIDAIARHLAVPSTAAREAITALIGSVVEAYQRLYAARGKGIPAIADLVDALAPFGGGGMAVDVMMPARIDAARGQGLLVVLFGSAERARLAVEASARASGIDAGLLGRTLPLLAMLIGGYLSARAEAMPQGEATPEQRKALVAEFENLLVSEQGDAFVPPGRDESDD